MKLIVKDKKLYFNKDLFTCSIGRNGLTNNKREGDGKTPVGIFRFTEIFYREDKISKLDFKIKTNIIQKNYGWCDDPRHEMYNKLIKLPSIASAENLYRNDTIYDLLIVINYNMDPVVPFKGSAIFLHIAHDDLKSTEGCIALRRDDLLNVAENISENTVLIIES